MTHRKVLHETDKRVLTEEEYQSSITYSLRHRLILSTSNTFTALIRSELITGRNKTGARWYRWRDRGQMTFKMKKNGYGDTVGYLYLRTVKVRSDYYRGRTVSNFMDVTTNPDYALYFLQEYGTYIKGFKLSEILDTFSRSISNLYSQYNVEDTLDNYFSGNSAAFYPVLRGMSDRKLLHGSNITRAAKTSDVNIFVTRIFGKTRYRKDLVKAVANVQNIRNLEIAHTFRGHVPIDWIINFLRSDVNIEQVETHKIKSLVSSLREVLPLLDMNLRRRLLTSIQNNSSVGRGGFFLGDICIILSDILDLRGEIPDEVFRLKFKTVKEFHDKLSVLDRKYAREADKERLSFPLPSSKFVESIRKYTSTHPGSAVSIRMAETPFDLVDWGDKMHHCIGSYTQDALANYGAFGAIYENDHLVGNLHYSLTNDKMIQILGKYNDTLKVSTLECVYGILHNATQGQVTPSKFTGYGTEKMVYPTVARTRKSDIRFLGHSGEYLAL